MYTLIIQRLKSILAVSVIKKCPINTYQWFTGIIMKPLRIYIILSTEFSWKVCIGKGDGIEAALRDANQLNNQWVAKMENNFTFTLFGVNFQ